MGDSIFSTYRTGENRVTASILAVLRSIALTRIERLLGAMLGESEFELVSFNNQLSAGGAGVPDATIASSCKILIETKTEPSAVSKKQIERHLARFEENPASLQRLLVLTPDVSLPSIINDLEDDRVVWASFADLDKAINDLIADSFDVVSEREQFLLRELQTMLSCENLLGSDKDTVVVAARSALGMYIHHGVYICQPNRSFRQVKRIAFYKDNQIYEYVPSILEIIEDTILDDAIVKDSFKKPVARWLKERPDEKGDRKKIMLLSDRDNEDTLRLDAPIKNDLRADSGRRIAFTQGQRYIDSKSLREAKTTSGLT